ncbi:OmpL47-type beta-barrel domain-containing protein [Paenibacillus sp. Soil787]|uniref:OmpL47-type beta-barrel domain-containing protein n=1 Tax=Paenibacillus sp. Soil787 TaxID=1736411 RepID=UPI0007021501|nr:DNRLRE domain-containing protein [Paenibacillus sp. Soil787]KRF43737.1 hypothetical protein ASG93_02130 [Paenibacillus sp. Soil787]
MRINRLRKKLVSKLILGLVLPLALFAGAVGQPQSAAADASFVHPGMIFTQADLDRMKLQVASNQAPAIYEWNNLKANPTASLNYAPSNFDPIVYRNDSVNGNKGNTNLYYSASAALMNAIEWYISGDQAYADHAIQLLNGWSYNLTSIQGHDAQLAASIYGYKLLNAAEIIRSSNAGWSSADISKFTEMMTNVFYPLTSTYGQVNGGWANGNWDAVDTVFNLSFGVWTENKEIYNQAVDYYKNGAGNGTVMHYILNDDGEVQESGRDQGHTQGGLAGLAEAAQIGWNQRVAVPSGGDMYSYPNNTYRLLKGIEYTAKYNLGYDVSYTPIPGVGYTLDDMAKGYSWIPGLAISPIGRGNFSPIYQQVYNLYVNNTGLPESMLPYTKQVIARQPFQAFALDFPSYGGLLFNSQDTPHSDQWGKSETITMTNRGAGKSIVVINDQSPASVEQQFISAADASVRGGTSAKINYGADATMTSKLSTADFTREAYLKFDLSGYAGTKVDSATVRLYAASVGANVGNTEADYVADDSWTESGVTWNTKPTSSAILATWPKPKAAGFIQFDVTNQLNAELAQSGDKKLSIRMQSLLSGDGVDYSTKEATTAGNRPTLILKNEAMSYRYAIEYLGTSNLYAYRSLANNKYLTVMSDGTLLANSNTIGTEQTFAYTNNGSGNVMKSMLNGKYVTVDSATGLLKANVDNVTNDYGRFDYQTPIDSPVTTATISIMAPDGQDGWYVHPVTLALSASASALQVKNTVYSLDEGQTWQTYAGPIAFDQDGQYSVWYESRDSGGGVEFARNVSFKLDATAPADATFAADMTAPTNHDVTVTISYPADAAVKEYKVGESGTWTAYGAPVVVSANDTVYARSKDAAGNISNETNYIVSNIDHIAPADAKLAVDTTAPTNQGVTVTISYPVDAAVKEYKVGESGAWTAYTASVIVSDNDTVYARGTDAVGNESNITSMTVSNIYKIAPVTAATLSPAAPNGNNSWYTTDVSVSLSVTANVYGGAVTTEYQVNDGAWTTYTGSIPAFSEGMYKFGYRSKDQAGNVEQLKTVEFKVDKTAPALNVQLDKTSIWPADHKMIAVNATVNPSDAISGVESVVLTSITSNQPDSGKGDIQASFGTAATSFSLRAEKDRIYTITYTATDKAGNKTVTTATVTVPHDQSGIR